jgi:hypothetical protein
VFQNIDETLCPLYVVLVAKVYASVYGNTVAFRGICIVDFNMLEMALWAHEFALGFFGVGGVRNFNDEVCEGVVGGAFPNGRILRHLRTNRCYFY